MSSNIDPLSMKGEMLLRKFSHLAHGVQNGPPVVKEMIRADYVHGMKRKLENTLEDYMRTDKRVQEGIKESERKMNNRIDRVKTQFEREKGKLREEVAVDPEQLSPWEKKKFERKLKTIDNKMSREIEDVSKQYEQKIDSLQKKKEFVQMDLENHLDYAQKAYSEMGTVAKIISGEIPPEQIPAVAKIEQPSGTPPPDNGLVAGRIVLKVR